MWCGVKCPGWSRGLSVGGGGGGGGAGEVGCGMVWIGNGVTQMLLVGTR